jgi:hypothetical protein
MSNKEGTMEIEVNPNISVLDQVKMQVQVLIPVLEALRAELGKERADRLVTSALREWLREGFQRLGARIPGSPKDKFDALWAMGVSRIQENDLEIVTLKQEPGAQEFNVTRCRYAEFFRQLGEPELGAVLLCETDFQVAEVGSPEVELVRTQTIMEGASCCDFRIHIKRNQIPN